MIQIIQHIYFIAFLACRKCSITHKMIFQTTSLRRKVGNGKYKHKGIFKILFWVDVICFTFYQESFKWYHSILRKQFDDIIYETVVMKKLHQNINLLQIIDRVFGDPVKQFFFEWNHFWYLMSLSLHLSFRHDSFVWCRCVFMCFSTPNCRSSNTNIALTCSKIGLKNFEVQISLRMNIFSLVLHLLDLLKKPYRNESLTWIFALEAS